MPRAPPVWRRRELAARRHHGAGGDDRAGGGPLEREGTPGQPRQQRRVTPPPAARRACGADDRQAAAQAAAERDAVAVDARDGDRAGVGEQHPPVPEVLELRRRQRHALAEAEGHGAHVGVGPHAGGQEGGDVGGPHGPEGHAKAAGLLHPVRGDAGGRQLRQDESPGVHHLIQARLAHHPCDLLGREGPLAGRAPDVDPAGVDHEQPDIGLTQGVPQDVERELVVGGDEHRRGGPGLSERVQTGAHAIVAAADPPAHAPGPQAVGALELRADARDRAGAGSCRAPTT